MTCFRPRQSRSTRVSCLRLKAMSSGEEDGSEERTRYLPSSFSSAGIAYRSIRKNSPAVVMTSPRFRIAGQAVFVYRDSSRQNR